MRIQQSFADESEPCLYICSTPIGNLQDVSLRLLSVLREADVIAAEDTRQTRKLLTHFEIHPKALISYHEHNELQRQKDLLAWWQEGKKVAVVSDAGTPGISDPGYLAVQLAVDEGVNVIPVPGPSAAVTALVASGISPQPFLFLGFLPRAKRQQKELLQKYRSVESTVIIYESPHRLLGTLSNLANEWGTRKVILARELTKRYETFLRGTLQEVTEYVRMNETRGECVIVLGPLQAHKQTEGEGSGLQWEEALAAVDARMSEGMSHREAVAVTAQEAGIKRRELYQATLRKTED